MMLPIPQLALEIFPVPSEQLKGAGSRCLKDHHLAVYEA